MKIKKFLAENLREGKARIIEELGEEAVILSSRIIKNPDTGKDIHEIVAALDDAVAPRRLNTKKQDAPKSQQGSDSPTRMLQSAIMSDKSNDKFLQYFETINDKINELNDYVKYRYSGSLGGVYSDLYKILRKTEFDDEYALQLTAKLHSISKYSELHDLISECRRMVSSDIPLRKGLNKTLSRQVSILIGPTGSGKTTSLVKMAVMTKLSFNAKVMIISADTYKVGGSEQLQTFASIAGIPFSVVYSSQELWGVLSKELNYDFIFIDTVGISPKVKEHSDNLQEVVNASKADHVLLVQSATSSYNNFKFVLRSFLKLNINGLILTKVDEVDSIAPLLGMLTSIDLPLAYITNGQRIPQDIELATKGFLGKLIIPESVELE